MARRIITRARMKKQWTSMPNSTTALTSAGTSIISGNLAFTTDVSTILRMIGQLVVTPLTDFTTTERSILTVAIGLFNSEAVAAGAASLSDPVADSNYPWLWWKSMVFLNSVGLDLGENALGGLTTRESFDVKSRRIVRPNDSLVMVGNYAQVVGGADMTVDVAHTRVLIALS